MSRDLTATTNLIDFDAALLSAAAGPWTLSLWWRPLNLTQSTSLVLSANSSGAFRHGLRWEFVSDSVDFRAVSHTGTDPTTSSDIAFNATDVKRGAWIAYRYAGASGAWDKFKNGTKTSINASITFALAAVDASTMIGRNAPASANAALGMVAEIGIWNVALSDSELADLHRGIAADQIARGGLQRYWPLRGTFDPERDWVSAAVGTVTGATKGTRHPTIIGKPTVPKYKPAWVLDLYHDDLTVKMASRDLYEERDVDILGDFYPGDIRSPETIQVSEELSDGAYGVQVPSTAVILTKPGPEYRDVIMEDEPVGYWRLQETDTSNAADDSGNGHAGVYSGGYTQDVRGPVVGSETDGRAVRLDGSTGYASVADHNDLDIVGALTISAWVWLDNRSNYRFIVTKNTSNADPQPYQLRTAPTTGIPEFIHSAGNIQAGTRGLQVGRWHHVAVTRAGGAGTTVTHYLDGVPNGSGVPAGTPTASAKPLMIGTRDDLFTYLPGIVCHVALYNQALSAERIALQYRVGLQAWKGKIGHSREWRGVRARLRRYDRETHELTEELSGVVQDVDYVGATITLGSEDRTIFDTPIPRRVVDIGSFPSATDLGAAIPVVFGSGAVVAPPYCGRDDNGGDDPEQRDFLIGWQYDADAALMPIRVEKVWEDIESDPGLELLTEWIAGPGTPTYVSTSKFSVGSDLETSYPPGLPVRFKTTASGSEWVYSNVVAYDGAASPDEVEIANANLDSGLNSLQLSAEYLVERGRYSLASENLLSIRRDDGSFGSPVVKAQNSAITNPAKLIDEVLRNTRWGLGLAVNADAIADAAAAYSAASMTIAGALGWNKQQRPARDVLRDLLSMRGARMSRDAVTGEFHVVVDTAADSPVYTLGFGDGYWQNVAHVRSVRRRTLSEAIRTVRYRFGLTPVSSVPDGLRGSIALVPERYQFFVDADALEIGRTTEVTNPYVVHAATARRAAYYIGQNLRASDLGIEIDGGMEMRNLRAGDLVRFLSPVHGLDATYRVWRTTRRLGEMSVLLRGYDADVYTFDAAKVTDTTDVTDRDERASTPGVGLNHALNGDFSAGLTGNLDTSPLSAVLPGWDIDAVVGGTTIATVADIAAVGGYYLDFTGNGFTELWNFGRIAVEGQGSIVIFSCYCDRADYWQPVFRWYDSGGSLISEGALSGKRRLTPIGGAAGLNGKGWRRYYAVESAPANAVSGTFHLRFQTGTLRTFRFDGVQLEHGSRRNHKPTEFKPALRYGFDPAQLQAGALTIRPTGQPEGGLSIVNVDEELTAPGSGTTMDSTIQIPAGAALVSVSGKVTQSFGSVTAMSVGLAADTTRFASGKAVTLGTQWKLTDHNANHVVFGKYAAATAVRFTFSGGTLNGTGKVRAMLSYLLNVAPTV